MSEPPFLLVIAGPNGSGKSTLTDHLLATGVDLGKYINPDIIAKTIFLPEPQRSFQAQAIAEAQRDACVASRLSFSFETVMSHPSKIEFMQSAYDAGYLVTLYFVSTSDPDINVSRVENRVEKGGHNVPHDRVVARYARSVGLLPRAALVAHRTIVFDNSLLAVVHAGLPLTRPNIGPRPVAEVVRDGNNYAMSLEAGAPPWVNDHLVKPMKVFADSSAAGISLAVRYK